MDNKNLEQSLRRKLKRRGYLMKKSRGQMNIDNHGGFMIIDIHTNAVVDGNRFNLNLSDVEDFIRYVDEQEVAL